MSTLLLVLSSNKYSSGATAVSEPRTCVSGYQQQILYKASCLFTPLLIKHLVGRLITLFMPANQTRIYFYLKYYALTSKREAEQQEKSVKKGKEKKGKGYNRCIKA